MLGRSVYNVHFVRDCTLTFIHLLSLAQAQKMPKLCQFASDLLLKQKLNSYIGNLWTSKIANILNKVVKCNECLSVIWLFNLGWTNDGSTWTIVKNNLKKTINITSVFSIPDHPVIRITWISEWECFEMHITRCQSRFVFSGFANLLHLEYFVFWAQPSIYTHYLPFHLFISVLTSQPIFHLPRSELLMHSDKLNSSRGRPIQTYRYDKQWCCDVSPN